MVFLSGLLRLGEVLVSVSFLTEGAFTEVTVGCLHGALTALGKLTCPEPVVAQKNFKVIRAISCILRGGYCRKKIKPRKTCLPVRKKQAVQVTTGRTVVAYDYRASITMFILLIFLLVIPSSTFR